MWRTARQAAVSSLLAVAITAAGSCGGGGAANPTAPSSAPQAPLPVSSQPPTINLNGLWEGTYTRNGGSGTIKFLLRQDGSSVTGSDSVTEDQERGGLFTGTLSGNTLAFTFNYGSNCVRTVSGTTSIASGTMTGTFSGGGPGCPEGPISNGRMSLTIWRPPVPPLLGTTWWGGFGPTGAFFGANFGAYGWIWDFSQVGSNGNGIVDIGGSVKMGPGAPSAFGPAVSTGTFTGTLTQDFVCSGIITDCLGLNTGVGNAPSSGAHYFWRVAFTIALSGQCSATLGGTDNPTISGDPFIGPSATSFNGTVSGTTCSGPTNVAGFNLCLVGSPQCQ
jgi:hypothetical protein